MTSKFKILVLDQFANISPYYLSVNAVRFDALCARALAGEYNRTGVALHFKPQVLEVDESYVPEMATTVFRADAEGNTEVWKYRWDSSG